MDRRQVIRAVAGAAALPAAAGLAAPAARASAPGRESRGRVLMVMTSVGKIPGSDRATGLWWSEFSEPYTLLLQAGYCVDVASILGGPVPVDPRSGGDSRARQDAAAWAASRETRSIGSVSLEPYAGVYLPGGHGTMWDFPENAALARLIAAADARGVPVASVCHGPAGLLGARRPDGRPIVAGRRVNGFTNAEEAAAGMTGVVPFLLETRLREQGGRFEHAGVFASFAVRDGTLITGQNPASSERTARLLIEAMAEAAARRPS